MTKSTMVELVTELEALVADPRNANKAEALRRMIAEAKAGEYHDFKNEKYVCGKLASAGMLNDLGFTALASRIEQGEFDEEEDEADDKKMSADIGQGVFQSLFGKKS